MTGVGSLKEGALITQLMRELLENLAQEVRFTLVSPPGPGGGVRAAQSAELQGLEQVTRLVCGLAGAFLSGKDLVVVWFVLRQEFDRHRRGGLICSDRLRWLRDSVLEIVQV